MTDREQDPSKLVNDLLKLYEKPEAKSGNVLFSSKDVMAVEFDFDNFSSPGDLAAICTLFMSALGTVVGSTNTGFAAAIRDTVLPKIYSETLASGAVKPQHIELFKTLTSSVLDKIAKDDETQDADKHRLPVNLAMYIKAFIDFGLAMHKLGQLNGDIKFETGFKTALFKALTGPISKGGVIISEGTFQAHLQEMIDDAVGTAQKDYKGKKND